MKKNMGIVKRTLAFLVAFVLLTLHAISVFADDLTSEPFAADGESDGEGIIAVTGEEEAGQPEEDGEDIDAVGAVFNASADELVSKAKSYIGCVNYDIGIETDWGWCVMFARKCAEEIGVYLSGSDVVTTFCNQAIQNDKAHFYGIEPYAMNTSKNYTSVSRQSFKPEPGDFVCFLWSWNDDGWYDHIGIVTDVSGSTMTYVDGNSESKNNAGREIVDWHTKNWTNNPDIKGYLRPNYTNRPKGREPVGRVDSVEGLDGKIRITGWAYDPDRPNESLNIHAYIGGPAGDGNAHGFGAGLKADLDSPDVNQAFGISGKHRFDVTLNTWKRGTQPVYVYAIDVGDIPADNRHIDNSPQNAVIKNAPYRVDYKSSFDLKKGETKTFSFTFQGDDIYTVSAEIGNGKVADGSLNAPGWGKDPVPASVQLTGIAPGQTVFTYKLLNKNNKVLYSESNNINVIQPVTGVALNKSKTTIDVGRSETLTATVAPSDASNKSVSWKSSDTSIAKVNSNGMITAVSPGTAVITVVTAAYYSSSYKAACKVTVTQPVTGVTLNKSKTTIQVGKGENLTAVIAPSNASDKNVQWTSSDTNVASVDNSGYVRAKNPGKATITVKTNNGGKTAACEVTVPAVPTGVILNPKNLTLRVGDSDTLTAQVTPEGVGGVSLYWVSGDKNIVTVDGNGTVTAVSPGTAKIAVRIKNTDYTDRCQITVIPAAEVIQPEEEKITPPIPVTGIELDHTKIMIPIGDAFQLNAMVIPSNATNRAVLWESDNPQVVVVSDSGLLEAVGLGKADIIAKTDDGGKVAKCKVEVYSKEQEELPSDQNLVMAVRQKITLTKDDFNLAERPAKYSSGDKKIAAVSNKGVLIGRGDGETTIKAYCRYRDGKNWVYYEVGEIKVTVRKPVLEPMEINKLSISLDAADYLKNAEGLQCKWKISGKKVATIDRDGVIRPLKRGTVTVSAVFGKAVYSTRLKVNVPVLSHKKISLRVDKVKRLKLKNTNQTVKWESEDESIANVDQTGVVTGVDTGVTTIYAIVEDEKFPCTVTIK